jgi:hypothetical protein
MILRAPRQVFALPFLLAVGCGGDRQAQPVTPAIRFTEIPPAAAGGSDRTVRIAGHESGAAPGQRIVLYARSGHWWVQPLTIQPYTTLRADGAWENSTHLGTEYAALLVDDTFRPPDKTESLPKAGGPVVAVATVEGKDQKIEPVKVLSFSGYEWQVRHVPSDRGGQNDYDPANAWTDADGLLHLRLAKRDGHWTSAEVILTRSLGYGTYAFTVRDTSGLDPAAAFGMFTWDEEALDQNHRELDIDISQWGDPGMPNAQYVLQPYYVPANVARFSAPAGTLTHAFRWEPGQAAFRTVRGRDPAGTDVVASRQFTSGVPSPGTERVRMNLYLFRYAPRQPRKDVEVVVERFQYLP